MLPDEKIATVRKQKTERQKRREVTVIRKVITIITVFLILLLIAAAILLIRQANSSGGLHWAWLDEFLGRETESSMSSITESSVPEPVSIVIDEPEDDSYLLIIVNSIHPLPKDFTPELSQVGDVFLEKNAAEALSAMTESAKKAGITLPLLRGYTTAVEQEEIYQQKYEELLWSGTSPAKAKDTASIWRPGWSESQTGLLLELSGNDEFESSNEFYWLCEHSAEFGFIFRYPEGKARKTGVAFNPKILRFVGTENAATMRQLDMCLEEYVRYLSDR